MTRSPRANSYTVVAVYKGGSYTTLFQLGSTPASQEALDNTTYMSSVLNQSLQMMGLRKSLNKTLVISPETDSNPQTFTWNDSNGEYSRLS